MTPATSRTRRLANIRRNKHAPCLETGQHPVLMATRPRRDAETVTVNYVCTECGRRVRVESWSHEAWEARAARTSK